MKDFLLVVSGALLMVCVLVYTQPCHAGSVTGEFNVGHQHEQQRRIGIKFDLSEHWQLDSGLSDIHYSQEKWRNDVSTGPGGQLYAIDTVLLRRIWIGKSYLAFGSGLALFSERRWGAQDSATSWTFANRIGFNYPINKWEVGVQFRHYSNLCFSPNTSKDFIGAQIAFSY